MQSLYKLFVLVLFVSGISYPSSAQDTLNVLVSGNPPFVMTDSLDPQGISVEVWEEVAQEHGINFKYSWSPNVDEALTQIKEGNADLLVGPISITSDRAKYVRFTQPYYISSYSILSSRQEPTVWDRIQPFFSKGFFVALSVLILILTIVGTLLWLAERRDNPEQFPQHPVEGIGNGIWLAVVTMTTVGYGDRAPVTLAGRIVAASWMIIALITATSLVAGIASTLTVSGLSTSTIQGAKDLAGNEVAVVGLSPAREFVEEHRGVLVEVDNMETALEKIKNKKVKALVYDRPQLKYYMENHPGEASEMTVGLGEYLPQGYGFALPPESPLSKTLSIYLLEMQEEGSIREIVNDWLGKGEDK